MTASIVVSDYVSGTNYSLDFATGSVVPAQQQSKVDGFGQWRTLGLFTERQRTFVAVFLRGTEFVLWVNGCEYELLEPGVSGRVQDMVPFLVRRFQLQRNGQTSFEGRYWFLQGQGWPDDGDIFSLVCRIVKSPNKARGFVHVWRAKSDGVDLGSAEFLRELQALVEEKVG
jgi:hypothetical protein